MFFCVLFTRLCFAHQVASKCGRVVCASCSPHRITIPRQFIVHPPDCSISAQTQSASVLVDLTGDNEEHPGGQQSTPGISHSRPHSLSCGSLSSNSATGGGEVVRVCNPCVPDPNFSPPPQQSTPNTSHLTFHHQWDTQSRQHEQGFLPSTTLPSQSGVSMSRPPLPPRPGDAQGIPPLRESIQHLGGFQAEDGYAQNHENHQNHHKMPYNRRHTLHQEVPHRYWNHSATSSPFTHQRLRPTNSYHRSNDSHTHFTSEALPSGLAGFVPNLSSEIPYPGPRLVNFNAPLPPIPGPLGLSSSQSCIMPRTPYSAAQLAEAPRGVPEEDECPICGNELPPKGPNNDETKRERHIDQCIRDHAYGESPSLTHHDTFGAHLGPATLSIMALSSETDLASSNDFISAPFQTSVPGVTPASVSSLANASPAAASASRPRRQTATRMLVYRASEKDCVDEDGQAQECVICFEEFEEGQEMGRLECLCKFHKVSEVSSAVYTGCIQLWTMQLSRIHGDCRAGNADLFPFLRHAYGNGGIPRVQEAVQPISYIPSKVGVSFPHSMADTLELRLELSMECHIFECPLSLSG